MKTIEELVKQDEFDKTDLRDIAAFCRSDESIAPLCAVAFISSDQKIEKDDLISLAKLLAKYPYLDIKY